MENQKKKIKITKRTRGYIDNGYAVVFCPNGCGHLLKLYPDLLLECPVCHGVFTVTIQTIEKVENKPGGPTEKKTLIIPS